MYAIRSYYADDEIDLLRPHIKFLEQKGFSVTAVPNGEDALAALAQGRFDVVLLDEMMPGLGGLATLDAIQARDLQLPVILVTKSEEDVITSYSIHYTKLYDGLRSGPSQTLSFSISNNPPGGPADQEKLVSPRKGSPILLG